MNTKETIARIETYRLTASNGRHIRMATKIVFQDGTERRFTERMSRKQALAQVR